MKRPSKSGGAAAAPVIRVLEREECEAILARNAVGRLAYSYRDRVDIVPIHFVYDGGWLYGRTSPGSKLEPIAHNHWVAFEVDEVEGIFAWRSVVVRGGLYVLHADGPEREQVAWERALDLMRGLVPQAGTAADPVPDRTVLFRVHADEMTGRESTPGPAPGRRSTGGGGGALAGLPEDDAAAGEGDEAT